MKLSVSLITYNHAPFIGQAIESCLQQVTDFDFEIVIGEDGSTDGTREIVQDYAARHPGRIRAFYRRREDVVYINGRPSGRFNFMETLKACQGEYVALLEGDDYWTDPHKLQRQVDYLAAHRDCAFCFHPGSLVDEKGAELKSKQCYAAKKEKYDLEDFLRARFFPWTCTVVFRRALLALPDWFVEAPAGDFPLHALNLQHGYAGMLDENMGAYRIHGGGIWSAGSHPDSWNDAGRLEGRLQTFQLLLRGLGPKYRRLLSELVATVAYDLVWLNQTGGDAARMRRYLLKALRACPFPPTVSAKFVLKAWLVAFMPGAHRLYQKRRAALSPPPAEG